MKRVNWVLGALVVGCAGCAYPGDDMSSLMVGDLDGLGRNLGCFSYDECLGVETLQDAVHVVEKKRILTDFRRYMMQEDRLGKPYVFVREVNEDSIFMRITSSGPNKRFENGGGDDIVLEVIVTKDHNRGDYKVLRNGKVAESSERLR